MSSPFTLRLYAGNDYIAEEVCTSFTLGREAYTPYNELAAEFISEHADHGTIDRVALFWGGTQIFLGLADSVTEFRRNGCRFTRVKSRSFTALMAQNELDKGLYDNMTIGRLVNGYYPIPYVTYEPNAQSDYIYLTEKTSLWDCIAAFGYKITQHYPYVTDNRICLSPSASAKLHTVTEEQVTEYGTVYDTTKLISHYHMEDIAGTQNAYTETDSAAVAANIIRHKYISLDRRFLQYPQGALTFRRRWSQRGRKAKYIVYEGFQNEELGERISLGTFLQNRVICRVLVIFGQKGMRTKIWAYEDGFYN